MIPLLSRRTFVSMASVPLILPSRIAFADRDARPNILLFFPDQHRPDWIGAGSSIPVHTPVLDRLAERGVRYSNAVCPSPVCAPSRACLASGMEYDRCGVLSNGVNYPLDRMSLYRTLRESGYHVMGCGKFDLHKPDRNWGRDGKRLIAEYGFSDGIDNAGKWDAYSNGREEPRDPYMAMLLDEGLRDIHLDDFARRREVGSYKATFPTGLPDHGYCDNWIGQNGLDLLQDTPVGKPWYLQVNFAGPHDPVDVTHDMHGWYDGVSFPQPIDSTRFDEETHLQIRRNYSAMVDNIDRWLGRYLDTLEERGELEHTLVVFSSDHGEMLGDHDHWAKNQPWQPSVGVPLVLAGPAVPEGRVVDAPATTLDLTATFLETAELQPADDMDSVSLLGNWDHREVVRSGLGNWRMAYDGEKKLIRNWKDRDETGFDRGNDPDERVKLDSTGGADWNRLRRAMDEGWG